MALADLTSRDAVLAAIESFDTLGRDQFLARYGFGRSRDYEVVHNGKRYDSKAIVGAAHGHQHPSQGPLASDDFSGGGPTINKLQELGFEVARRADSNGPGDRAGARLARFLEVYEAARDAPFRGDSEAAEALRAAATALRERLEPTLPHAIIRPSVGQGNWARVPWIAVLDPRETDSTQRGTYPVILIPQSLDGVYLTLAQGVTELKRELGSRAAYEEMRRRARLLRPRITGLLDHGFEFDGDVHLGDSPLGRDYAASVIASMWVSAADLPSHPIEDAMDALAIEYVGLVERGELSFTEAATPPTAPQVLCIYVGRGASTNFEVGGREGWWGWRSAPAGLESLRPGDLVLFGREYRGGNLRVDGETWQANSLGSAVVGCLEEPPRRTDKYLMPDERSGEATYPWKFRFDILGEHADVPLAPGKALSADAADAIRRSAIGRGHGQLAPVAGSRLLEAYAEDVQVLDTSATPPQIAEMFWSEVQKSGMQLNRDRTLAFLAAVLSKPFIILTGQSGSGKTQLAQRLGEWTGVDAVGRPRYLVVPVRPDWTGPEYLFGFPDGLRPPIEGRTVWSVPETLEFIFRADEDGSAPYVLVLDEMNLAHVERYFADFLSGIESDEPVLPRLDKRDGEWVATEEGGRIPLPRNLIVVGTVNVDETTYLFSPKVLDRAFTFEFRVAADDLDAALHRPARMPAAPDEILRLIVKIMRDAEWHFQNAHPAHEALLDDLRSLHRLLAPAGLDFGHRVVFEAMRFAALLHATAGAERDQALDYISLTKLLPKVHGSRQRLEPVLRKLIEFAAGVASDTAAPSIPSRLPLTAEKLERMLVTLLDAQFVSFTE